MARMSAEDDARTRALDALNAARQGTREEAQSAQVYALTAIAEALLAVHHVLIDVRNQLERISKRLN